MYALIVLVFSSLNPGNAVVPSSQSSTVFESEALCERAKTAAIVLTNGTPLYARAVCVVVK